MKIKSILVSLVMLSGCSALPGKYIYTEIEIGAPPKVVWDIIENNEHYPEWNPYHVSVKGLMRLGEKLEVVLHKPNGEVVEIDPHVIRIIPMRELTWGGGIKGIFYGEHVFLLQRLSSGNTKLIQKEEFKGIAIPFASLDAIEEGYVQMNEALKRKAESISHINNEQRISANSGDLL